MVKNTSYSSIHLTILPIHPSIHSTDPALLSSDPYEGQLRLVDGNVQSTGLLEIYLHNQWGTVCSQGFNDAAANSVCRQLGYTNAINISHGSG